VKFKKVLIAIKNIILRSKWLGPEKGLTDAQSAGRVLFVAELFALSSIAAFVTWPNATGAAIALGVVFTTAWFSGKYVVLPVLAYLTGQHYDPYKE